MLYHSPRNGKTVKVLVPRPISSKTKRLFLVAFRRILATSVISTIKVLCPLARSSEAPTLVKNTVADTDICLLGRYKTAKLCHKHDQGSLSHVGRLTCHVRTGNRERRFFPLSKKVSFATKQVIPHHLLYYRMTAVFDLDHTFFINRRLYIIPSCCNGR